MLLPDGTDRASTRKYARRRTVKTQKDKSFLFMVSVSYLLQASLCKHIIKNLFGKIKPNNVRIILNE